MALDYSTDKSGRPTRSLGAQAEAKMRRASRVPVKLWE